MKNLVGSLVLGIPLLWAPAAFGQSQPTAVIQNPSGICDGATPAYDALLRKTPTKVANVGTKVAYVSCSLPLLFPNEVDTVSLFVRNPNRVKGSVSCTLVDGTNGADAPPTRSYAQSYAFAAGDRTWMSFYWEPAAYGLVTFSGPVNLSCALSPGMELDNIGEEFVAAP